MFKAYRCKFCGDVYMGDGPSSHCPYCGAHNQFLLPVEQWVPPAIASLSPQAKTNLEGALRLEVENAAYYSAAAGKVAELPWQGVFKYLARIESEHASTIRKALGLAVNPAAEQYDVTPDLKAAIGEIKRRESRAEEFYGKALEEASEPRAQEIFSILIEIEADHLNLANETLGKLA